MEEGEDENEDELGEQRESENKEEDDEEESEEDEGEEGEEDEKSSADGEERSDEKAKQDDDGEYDEEVDSSAESSVTDGQAGSSLQVPPINLPGIKTPPPHSTHTPTPHHTRYTHGSNIHGINILKRVKCKLEGRQISLKF